MADVFISYSRAIASSSRSSTRSSSRGERTSGSTSRTSRSPRSGSRRSSRASIRRTTSCSSSARTRWSRRSAPASSGMRSSSASASCPCCCARPTAGPYRTHSPLGTGRSSATGTTSTGVRALVEALDTDLEWVSAHTRLLQRAVEWDNEGREGSYLLRGRDLAEAERWLSAADRGARPAADAAPARVHAGRPPCGDATAASARRRGDRRRGGLPRPGAARPVPTERGPARGPHRAVSPARGARRSRRATSTRSRASRSQHARRRLRIRTRPAGAATVAAVDPCRGSRSGRHRARLGRSVQW